MNGDHVFFLILSSLIGAVIVTIQALRSNSGALKTLVGVVEHITADKPLMSVLEDAANTIDPDLRKKMLALLDFINPNTATQWGDLAQDVKDWIKEVFDGVPLADKPLMVIPPAVNVTFMTGAGTDTSALPGTTPNLTPNSSPIGEGSIPPVMDTAGLPG